MKVRLGWAGLAVGRRWAIPSQFLDASSAERYLRSPDYVVDSPRYGICGGDGGPLSAPADFLGKWSRSAPLAYKATGAGFPFEGLHTL